mmetsp:Transcript_7968/g.20414  ORF Transcript_7968/g.20414 Transcript_7968/m.20414 type:complete len:270 (-) Transcript_7968:934-1743(-)
MSILICMATSVKLTSPVARSRSRSPRTARATISRSISSIKSSTSPESCSKSRASGSTTAKVSASLPAMAPKPTRHRAAAPQSRAGSADAKPKRARFVRLVIRPTEPKSMKPKRYRLRRSFSCGGMTIKLAEWRSPWKLSQEATDAIQTFRASTTKDSASPLLLLPAILSRASFFCSSSVRNFDSVMPCSSSMTSTFSVDTASKVSGTTTRPSPSKVSRFRKARNVSMACRSLTRFVSAMMASRASSITFERLHRDSSDLSINSKALHAM